MKNGFNNKLKLSLILFVVLLSILVLNLVFAKEVKAATPYNSEISYTVDYFGFIHVEANNKNIESATIPDYIDGKKVSFVTGFNDCKKLKSVSIPSGVTDIEYGAFKNCTSLTSINLPKYWLRIDTSAFEGCTSLTSIEITGELIGTHVFKDCSNLKNITFGEEVSIIPIGTFKNCTSLTSINIPSHITAIGDSAFAGCTSLKSITIPETVTEIGAYDIFSGCTSLKTAKIYAKVTDLANGMFQNCTALTNVTFSDSIEHVATDSFRNCTELTSIKLPAKSLWNAFEGCTKLKNIYFTKNIQEISDDVHESIDKSKVTFYVYPNTVAKTYAQKYGIKYVECIPFEDIYPDHWAYSAVKYVYENNIIKGLNATTFAPEDKLTRGMMVTILYRMAGSPKVSGTSKFKDVKDTSQWYYNAVLWASNNKIASGYDNGNFGPNDNITREQLAVFLYKYAKFKGKNVSASKALTSFKDGNKVSKFATTQMKWATAVGVITGNNNTTPPTLNPTGTATRAEAASMLYKYCTKVGK